MNENIRKEKPEIRERYVITKMSLIFSVDDYFEASSHKRIEDELWVMQHSLTRHNPERMLMKEQNFNWIMGALATGYLTKIFIVDGYSRSLYDKLITMLGNVVEGFGIPLKKEEVHKYIVFNQVDSPRKFNNRVNRIEGDVEAPNVEIINCIKHNTMLTDYFTKRFPWFKNNWEQYLAYLDSEKKQAELRKFRQQEFIKQMQQTEEKGFGAGEPPDGSDDTGGLILN